MQKGNFIYYLADTLFSLSVFKFVFGICILKYGFFKSGMFYFVLVNNVKLFIINFQYSNCVGLKLAPHYVLDTWMATIQRNRPLYGFMKCYYHSVQPSSCFQTPQISWRFTWDGESLESLDERIRRWRLFWNRIAGNGIWLSRIGSGFSGWYEWLG